MRIGTPYVPHPANEHPPQVGGVPRVIEHEAVGSISRNSINASCTRSSAWSASSADRGAPRLIRGSMFPHASISADSVEPMLKSRIASYPAGAMLIGPRAPADAVRSRWALLYKGLHLAARGLPSAETDHPPPARAAAPPEAPSRHPAPRARSYPLDGADIVVLGSVSQHPLAQ